MSTGHGWWEPEANLPGEEKPMDKNELAAVLSHFGYAPNAAITPSEIRALRNQPPYQHQGTDPMLDSKCSKCGGSIQDRCDNKGTDETPVCYVCWAEVHGNPPAPVEQCCNRYECKSGVYHCSLPKGHSGLCHDKVVDAVWHNQWCDKEGKPIPATPMKKGTDEPAPNDGTTECCEDNKEPKRKVTKDSSGWQAQVTYSKETALPSPQDLAAAFQQTNKLIAEAMAAVQVGIQQLSNALTFACNENREMRDKVQWLAEKMDAQEKLFAAKDKFAGQLHDPGSSTISMMGRKEEFERLAREKQSPFAAVQFAPNPQQPGQVTIGMTGTPLPITELKLPMYPKTTCSAVYIDDSNPQQALAEVMARTPFQSEADKLLEILDKKPTEEPKPETKVNFREWL